MDDCLILRFDAPLMSFGGVVVDQNHPVERFPGASMLTGLIGNAAGWRHGDTAGLQALQGRVQFAARWDVPPELLMDYQTVDLGQEHLVDTGWTTRGRRENRGKGAATRGTHIRYRHYWANGVMTLALALRADPDGPVLADVETSLSRPARPLFLGRKVCLPGAPLLRGRRAALSPYAALVTEPLDPRARGSRLEACWPIDEEIGGEVFRTYDTRDWLNQMHVGSRAMRRGFIEIRT